MRKKSLIFVVLLAFVCMVPQKAFANMAAPEDADVGSASCNICFIKTLKHMA